MATLLLQDPLLVGCPVTKIASGKCIAGGVHIPAAQKLVSVAELKIGTNPVWQCIHYLFVLSRHRPVSPVQYGFIANTHGFRLIRLSLDSQEIWPQVSWNDQDYIPKLYSYMKLVLTQEKQPPHLLLKDVAEVSGRTIALYLIQLEGQGFKLLPIFTGRGNGRKPLVLLGSNKSQEVVLKLAWYADNQLGRERVLLARLEGTPGVVQIDVSLSVDKFIEFEGGRTCSLLALKTVGRPLCSAGSVLSFLEAMYDLLKYCDIWFTRRESCTAIGRVKVALADFDHATDLRSSENELVNATGTPMFMASDVIAPSSILLRTFTPCEIEMIQDSVRGIDKYADMQEKTFWDECYQQTLNSLALRDASRDADESFKHGAVHDAESVFCALVLFFNRLWPVNHTIADSEMEALQQGRGKLFQRLSAKKVGDGTSRPFADLKRFPTEYFSQEARFKPFVKMLNSMLYYLTIPWYNIAGTGSGEEYEFHLHDYMQRLLLKEIRRLREEGDPIFLERNPLPVKTETQVSGDEYSTNAQPLPASRFVPSAPSNANKRALESMDEQLNPRKRFKSNAITADHHAGDLDHPALPVSRPCTVDMPSQFQDSLSQEFWDIYCWKKRERLWFVSNKLYD